MKRMLFAAAMAAGLAMSGAAAAGPMDAAYGNTVVVDYGGGQVVRLFINADGSYTGVGPDGSQVGGNWAISGGQTCFTQTSPGPSPTGASCSSTVTKNVGDTWQAPGAGGAPATVTIVAGR